MCMHGCLCVCMCVCVHHVHVWHPLRSEEGDGFPGTEVTDNDDEPPRGNFAPLQEQQVLLTPSCLSPALVFMYVGFRPQTDGDLHLQSVLSGCGFSFTLLNSNGKREANGSVFPLRFPVLFSRVQCGGQSKC